MSRAVAQVTSVRDGFEVGMGNPAGWAVTENGATAVDQLSAAQAAVGSQRVFLQDQDTPTRCHLRSSAGGRIQLAVVGAAEDPLGLVGTTLDQQYRVDGLIGEGGFGLVYRGFHVGFEQPIAIKFLKVPPHFTAEARQLFWDRFRDEGKHLARLADHPAIVRIYALGTAVVAAGATVPYLVLEWLEGKDLSQLLQERAALGQGPFAESEALQLLRPAVEAIAMAHGQGIAHRDLKPANLFLAHTLSGTRLKVLDFGIAKAMQEGEAATQLVTHTSSGFRAFSPQHGAPEQYRPKEFGATGPWTDVHALGLILVELVAGRPALRGEEAVDIYMGAISETRPTPRECGVTVSEGLEQICAKALARAPRERFGDAAELLAAVDVLLAQGSASPGHDAAAVGEPLPAVPGDAAMDTGDYAAQRGLGAQPEAAMDTEGYAAARGLAMAPAGRAPPEPQLPPTVAQGPGAEPTAVAAATVPGEPVAQARAGTVPQAPHVATELPTEARGPGLGTVPAQPFEPAPGQTALAGTAMAAGPSALPHRPTHPTPPVNRKAPLWLGAAIGGVGILIAVGLVVALVPDWTDDEAAQRSAGSSDPRLPVAASARPGRPAAQGPMVQVPAGAFWMGCSQADTPSCADDETPRRQEQVGAFWIDRTEVTVAQYRRCVDAGRCQAPSTASRLSNWARADRDTHPVNCVRWSDADSYCRWKGKRLPTERQWEKAARGTDGRLYPWGAQEPSCRWAVIDQGGNGCGRETTWPVGSKPAGASPYGSLDMVGSVQEWVEGNHESKARDGTPHRVVRGGGWRDTGPFRASARGHWPAKSFSISLGFRCVKPGR